jgi:hypothetical protein
MKTAEFLHRCHLNFSPGNDIIDMSEIMGAVIFFAGEDICSGAVAPRLFLVLAAV